VGVAIVANSTVATVATVATIVAIVAILATVATVASALQIIALQSITVKILNFVQRDEFFEFCE
jgi:hypothetical protein